MGVVLRCLHYSPDKLMPSFWINIIVVGLAGFVFAALFFLRSRLRKSRLHERVFPDRTTLGKLGLIIFAMIAWGYFARELLRHYLPGCEPITPYQRFGASMVLYVPIFALAAYGSVIVQRKLDARRITDYLREALSKPRFRHRKK